MGTVPDTCGSFGRAASTRNTLPSSVAALRHRRVASQRRGSPLPASSVASSPSANAFIFGRYRRSPRFSASTGAPPAPAHGWSCRKRLFISHLRFVFLEPSTAHFSGLCCNRFSAPCLHGRCGHFATESCRLLKIHLRLPRKLFMPGPLDLELRGMSPRFHRTQYPLRMSITYSSLASSSDTLDSSVASTLAPLPRALGALLSSWAPHRSRRGHLLLLTASRLLIRVIALIVVVGLEKRVSSLRTALRAILAHLRFRSPRQSSFLCTGPPDAIGKRFCFFGGGAGVVVAFAGRASSCVGSGSGMMGAGGCAVPRGASGTRKRSIPCRWAGRCRAGVGGDNRDNLGYIPNLITVCDHNNFNHPST